tara:strand:- start:1509 stop:1850 length:342 start_codon:yes stop_codon:yes gene_type:complete
MTSLQQTTLPYTREVDKNTLVHKLERHQKDLLQLRLKLNSYICEPKTYTHFERIETLKHALENLRSENAYILVTLKERNGKMEDYAERIKKQLQQFKALQYKVEEYIKGVRNY